jgi:hypothetical protein
MTRIRTPYEERPPDREAGEFFVIRSAWTCFAVTTATAAAVMNTLSRRWRPRWVGFVDLHGCRVRVRTDTILMIHESGARQRQSEREFDRALSREEEADRRPWEDGE